MPPYQVVDFFKYLLNYVDMDVFVCGWVGTHEHTLIWRTEEGISSLGDGVIDSYKPVSMGTRNPIGSSVRIIPLLKHRAISLTPIVMIILHRYMLYILLYILSYFTDLFRVKTLSLANYPVVTIRPLTENLFRSWYHESLSRMDVTGITGMCPLQKQLGNGCFVLYKAGWLDGQQCTLSI